MFEQYCDENKGRHEDKVRVEVRGHSGHVLEAQGLEYYFKDLKFTKCDVNWSVN